ncbi:isoamylase early set domain-containing protein [Desulfovibrio sp. OttesenSCG-928-I05]|nr:isoamylase early set domain-containing protein [Desulfovibrio sp. OttesenSCG-928-I05]
MAIVKQFLKVRPTCKVKFTLSADDACGAASVALVGDFNDWNPEATPMRRMKNGNFSAEVELAPEATYKFRYRADDGRWINEAEADGYEFCEFAQADNCMLKL